MSERELGDWELADLHIEDARTPPPDTIWSATIDTRFGPDYVYLEPAHRATGAPGVYLCINATTNPIDGYERACILLDRAALEQLSIGVDHAIDSLPRDGRAPRPTAAVGGRKGMNDQRRAIEQLAAVVRDIDGFRVRLDRLSATDGIPRPRGEEAPLLTAARAVLSTHWPAPSPAGEVAAIVAELREVARDVNIVSAWISGSNRDEASAQIVKRLDALAVRLEALAGEQTGKETGQ